MTYYQECDFVEAGMMMTIALKCPAPPPATLLAEVSRNFILSKFLYYAIKKFLDLNNHQFSKVNNIFNYLHFRIRETVQRACQ